MSDKPNNPEPSKAALDPADCPDEPTHTPEPWSYHDGVACGLFGLNGEPICEWDVPYDADAERIVACVNACAGMADPGKTISLLMADPERPTTTAYAYAKAKQRTADHDRELAERVRDACKRAINDTRMSWLECTETLAGLGEAIHIITNLDIDAVMKGGPDGRSN